MFDLMQTIANLLTDVDISWIGFSIDAMMTFSEQHVSHQLTSDHFTINNTTILVTHFELQK